MNSAAAEDEEWETADVNLGSLKLVRRFFQSILKIFVYFFESRLNTLMTLFIIG